MRLILTRLDDMKAEDTVTIDLNGKTSIADYHGRDLRPVATGMSAPSPIVCSRTSTRPACRDLRVEGMPHCDWVLIDAGDVIVHVFRPEVRAFYNLEKMWASARPRRRQAS